MTVKLLHYTPLWVTSEAIRTCWDSHDKSDTVINDCGGKTVGQKDIELIERVSKKFKHSSTIEHLYVNLEISGISRAVLMELTRTRIASYSVKSSRYTLKELKSAPDFFNSTWDYNWDAIKDFLVLTGDIEVDTYSADALIKLQKLIRDGKSNDKAKYAMPECFKTSLRMTINMRSLRNFLELRSAPSALWEIRELANKIFEALPEDYKFLAEDVMYENPSRNS